MLKSYKMHLGCFCYARQRIGRIFLLHTPETKRIYIKGISKSTYSKVNIEGTFACT